MYTLKLFNNGLRTNQFWDEWDKAFFEEDWGRWRENIVPHKEHKDGYDYWINLAGFKKEDVEAVLHDGVVGIKAKNKDGSTASYSFQLNEDADISTLSSKLEDGLLTVNVKKVKEAQPQSIEIK